MNAAWPCKYIGLRYEKGAQGPTSFDCWHFFRHVMQQEFAIAVPAVPEINQNDLRAMVKAFHVDPERERWRAVTHPLEGDAVLMSHNTRPHHIGIWSEADGGAVLHCLEGSGVVFTGLQRLRLFGFNVTGYYRHL